MRDLKPRGIGWSTRQYSRAIAGLRTFVAVDRAFLDYNSSSVEGGQLLRFPSIISHIGLVLSIRRARVDRNP